MFYPPTNGIAFNMRMYINHAIITQIGMAIIALIAG
jgi:hypothetical protein